MENGMNKGKSQVHDYCCNKDDMIDYANAVIEFVQGSMGANWELDLSENARHGLVLILGACSNTLKAAKDADEEYSFSQTLPPKAGQSVTATNDHKPTLAKVS